MEKLREIIKNWKMRKNDPLNIIFEVTFTKSEFDEMISEIEQLELDKEYWKKKCLEFQEQSEETKEV